MANLDKQTEEGKHKGERAISVFESYTYSFSQVQDGSLLPSFLCLLNSRSVSRMWSISAR